MKEYEELGHMERIPSCEANNHQRVYLSHHATIKASSQTTKVRVVFNASRASANNTSLNDQLLIGLKLQTELFALILRWRSHKFVYSTDIEKMFRQIRVHREDVDYQCIFWRPDPTHDLSTFRLLMVTYGIASAPYLANRVLKQLSSDEKERFPLASPVFEHEIYVDDLMFGAEDIVILKQTRDELTQLLMAGGFRPHKWASNDPRLLSDIDAREHGLAIDKPLCDDSSIKILGLAWSPTSDTFKVHTQLTLDSSFTKRSFLSLLARIFDPLGWVAPVTITAKIIMQSLWLRKIEWDELLPNDLLQRCLTYQAQLPNLNQVSIPRWTGQGSETLSTEIHGFADASNVAYAAVIYVRLPPLGAR